MEFRFDMGRSLPSLRIAIATIGVVISLSLVLVHHYESTSWSDSLFLIIDSMTHAHFGGYPKALETKVIMAFLTIFGVGVLVYVISVIVEVVVSMDLLEAMGVKGINKEINLLNDHVIVCGYGRVGSVVGKELNSNGIPFCVIEQKCSVVDKLRSKGILSLCGDASDPDMLRAAGIGRANFLVTVIGDDSETIVVILAAKEACSGIRIIARAGSEVMAKRMFQIGAERIILPEYVGAMEIAESIIHKQVSKRRGMLSPEDLDFMKN